MTDKKIDKAIRHGSGKVATAKVESAPRPSTPGLGRPISVTISHDKENKRAEKTSSRGARRFAQIDRRVSKAVRRIAHSFDHGVDTYIEHRKSSAEKRRDGAAVDWVENFSYGVSTAISEASPVLHDIGEALNTRATRKQIRKLVKGFGRLPF
jgi:hypothetical protein